MYFSRGPTCLPGSADLTCNARSMPFSSSYIVVSSFKPTAMSQQSSSPATSHVVSPAIAGAWTRIEELLRMEGKRVSDAYEAEMAPLEERLRQLETELSLKVYAFLDFVNCRGHFNVILGQRDKPFARTRSRVRTDVERFRHS